MSLYVDVGACEYINKIKIKMEFEDQLHTEHSKSNVLLLHCIDGCEEKNSELL